MSALHGIEGTLLGMQPGDVWARRISLPYSPTVTLVTPSLEDLILTKRWGLRQKDISDIQLLEALIASRRRP
jgi:hypothetical protein